MRGRRSFFTRALLDDMNDSDSSSSSGGEGGEGDSNSESTSPQEEQPHHHTIITSRSSLHSNNSNTIFDPNQQQDEKLSLTQEEDQEMGGVGTTSNATGISSIGSSSSSLFNKTGYSKLKQLSTPSCFNILDKSAFIKVDSRDLITVKYVGNVHQEIGTVRSNIPFGGEKLIDYFEIEIKSLNERACSVVIGLTDEKSDFIPTRYPGFDFSSFGLNGMDGKVYTNGKGIKQMTTRFFEGDVIGCGINYHQKEIFFTKNGTLIGAGFSNVISSGKLYPTVSLHSKNEEIKGIFNSFTFNLESMNTLEQKLINQSVEKVVLFEEQKSSADSGNELNSLIRDYLYYMGYSETLKTFEQSAPFNNNSSNDNDFCDYRKKICKLIELGNSHAAYTSIYEQYPTCLEKHQDVKIRVLCQIVIELLQQNKLMEALKFARETLSQFIIPVDTSSNGGNSSQSSFQTKFDEKSQKLIMETLGLFAFSNLSSCSFSYLLEQDKRNELSFEVNQMLLMESGYQKKYSSIETCYRQLSTVKNTLLSSGSGKLFN